jgi:hypothetical protein
MEEEEDATTVLQKAMVLFADIDNVVQMPSSNDILLIDLAMKSRTSKDCALLLLAYYCRFLDAICGKSCSLCSTTGKVTFPNEDFQSDQWTELTMMVELLMAAGFYSMARGLFSSLFQNIFDRNYQNYLNKKKKDGNNATCSVLKQIEIVSVLQDTIKMLSGQKKFLLKFGQNSAKSSMPSHICGILSKGTSTNSIVCGSGTGVFESCGGPAVTFDFIDFIDGIHTQKTSSICPAPLFGITTCRWQSHCTGQ